MNPATDGGETTTVGPGETSRWRNVLGAKRPGGETSRGRNVLVAKRPGGETSCEGVKRPGGETSINLPKVRHSDGPPFQRFTLLCPPDAVRGSAPGPCWKNSCPEPLASLQEPLATPWPPQLWQPGATVASDSCTRR